MFVERFLLKGGFQKTISLLRFFLFLVVVVSLLMLVGVWGGGAVGGLLLCVCILLVGSVVPVLLLSLRVFFSLIRCDLLKHVLRVLLRVAGAVLGSCWLLIGARDLVGAACMGWAGLVPGLVCWWLSVGGALVVVGRGGRWVEGFGWDAISRVALFAGFSVGLWSALLFFLLLRH